MNRRTVLMALTFVICHLSFGQMVTQEPILSVTDPAMRKSLNGEWRLKVMEGIDEHSTAVPPLDNSWGSIPVPGCWEAYGFCKPSYDKALPLTGYYRTTFSIPKEWKGQRIVLRFDGVLYGYDLFVNDQLAGSWRSGYNTAMFDITPCLDKKSREQHLAMRVITQFPGSDFDYNDDWAPSGIFRDVTLMAVPHTHLKDLTIRTKNTGEVTVYTETANKTGSTTVRHEILDAGGQVVGTDRVEHPHLWTAETPYLYTLRTRLMQKNKVLQTFEHRFGFRELTIDGNVLKLNGTPIKLRGVTCHSTDPLTVKVIDEVSILRDMRLMKEASVNYIRTSHYPRESRFYELADSLGFYIIDEVPFGFGDKHLSDTTFYPVLQQRAEATIRRDKNHPSVLIWSLGNENPLTDICIRLGDYVRQQLDSSRPVCYPQVGSYFRRFRYEFPKVAGVYAPHYPTTSQIADFYQRADRPVIFTEYCHTLGISFEDHDRQWELIERTPCIAGGSVWEWVDQGMPFEVKGDDVKSGGTYGYEERVFCSERDGFEMHGNKGTDGLLYADRTPLPNYYELQRNYARAFVDRQGEGSDARWKIVNRYDFLNLKGHVNFLWRMTEDRRTIASGQFSPDCAPRSTVVVNVDSIIRCPLSPDRLYLLHFDIVDAQGCRFLQQSFVIQKPEFQWTGTGNVRSVVQEGPLVRTGRKATLAEHVTQKNRLIERYLLPLENSQVKADVQRKFIEGGEEIAFTLTPDTTDLFRPELGLAFLLDRSIDRVRWIGRGPYATYPGRQRASHYGFWAQQQGDLYFEGNHGGIDAALFTDADGNGVLVTGDSLDINFEQTDCGIVMTVNAAVAGQGPKFAKTAFPIKAHQASERFRLYHITFGSVPPLVQQLFGSPSEVPQPLHPFVTQYDTYLMRYADIKSAR